MPILGRKSKAAPPKYRVEKVPVAPKRSGLVSSSSSSTVTAVSKSNGLRAASSTSSPSSRLSPNPSSSTSKIKSTTGAQQRTTSKSASPYPSSSSDERRNKRKAAITRSSTPRDSPACLSDESDDDSDDEDVFEALKRRKVLHESRDPNRKLRHKRAFGDEVTDAKIIHAADLVSVKAGCSPIFGAKEDEVAIELQYPSRSRFERYELVWKKDRIDVIKDILRVVKEVSETYLTKSQAKPFNDTTVGFQRQMERASNEKIGDIVAFKLALSNYNKELFSLVKNGSIAKNLDQTHQLPPDLVDFILTQVYDRTVAPQSELLNRYQAGSDNVYGELQYKFVRKILIEHGKMTSDQVFVDLGSGVGNVVLQAALEIGCRSYGCEVVEQSCKFAEAQEAEFNARCRLWGIRHGRVQLERGDFRKNAKISSVLKEADVILVNNKAFGPELNDNLVSMFLDLKTGCKIISLKNFVHGNANSAVNDMANNILDVESCTYGEDWVSWAASKGEYFVSTKKV